jgi:hypothetical protein
MVQVARVGCIEWSYRAAFLVVVGVLNPTISRYSAESRLHSHPPMKKPQALNRTCGLVIHSYEINFRLIRIPLPACFAP